ncbi:MAG TPA: hypothetical protein VHZ98_04575 [Galbitalea sp.]|jgi:hypothetical protein|nr:hypothetical protein [Galbitalea sp.]
MLRRVLWIALATLAIASVTALIFLIRAGDPGVSNWPINFELRSSDNGVLFQFAQDVFGGRPLDWSFSPQVFVFPEIPISLTAYLLAGGTVQAYYLVVAILNSALLFLALAAIIRYLYPGESQLRRLARSAVAIFPLLLLPLLGTTWLFEYQFAPTYYFGMYLMILLAPLPFLAPARPVKIAVGVGIALTAASNPLALVFTIPAFVCVVIVLAAASGFRTVLRPTVWVAATVAFALLIRLVFFGRLQGASPFAYVSTSIFSGRLQVVVSYVGSLLGDPVSAVVVVLGAVLALAGLAVAVIRSIRMIRHRPRIRAIPAVALYYALVPIAGLAGTLVLIITDYLYLWPVVILPFVLVLLPLPHRWVPWAAGIAAGALLVTGAVTGAAENLGRVSDYFSYRSPETRCLDSQLPVGMTVGYSTFSDARRIELT